MAVQATDLKFYRSIGASTSANNSLAGTVTSLGGAIDVDHEIISGVTHALFDAVPSSEATTGRVEYRCVYIVNTNTVPQTLYNAKVYFNNLMTLNQSEIHIALDAAGVGLDSSITLIDEIDSSSKLSGFTWLAANTIATGLLIGDMTGAGASKKAVWIRRTIKAGAEAGRESVMLRVVGDTDV